jgi:hypothetical protein
MAIRKRIVLLERSTNRLVMAADHNCDPAWRRFIHREAWVHLKRGLEIWVLTIPNPALKLKRLLAPFLARLRRARSQK